MPSLESSIESAVSLVDVGEVNKAPSLVRTDEYCQRANRREVLKNMGRQALDFSTTEWSLSLTTINVYDRSNGSIVIHYAGYEAGSPRDDIGMPHYGWSGGVETKKIVVAQYESEVGIITTGYLNLRNLRYVESDIRASKRAGSHEMKIQEAEMELKKALRERNEAIQRLHEAEIEILCAQKELQAAATRFQAAEAELLSARCHLKGDPDYQQNYTASD